MSDAGRFIPYWFRDHDQNDAIALTPLVDMESSLALHRDEDQELVNDLIGTIDELMEPTGIEGLALLQRRKLISHVEEIHDAAATFARQRDLDLPDVSNADLPGFRQSTGYVAERTRDGSRWALNRVKRGGGAARRALLVGRRRRRQLPPPDPATRSPHG